MPKRNLAGGKAFKKGRKVRGGDDEDGPVKFAGRETDQEYARILRSLGNRRMSCFCNDGVERICKIRGTLCWGPRKVRMEAGDIIIYSLRDFDTEGGAGDILSKVPHKFWSDVRKEAGIHPHLFPADGIFSGSDLFEEESDEESSVEDEETPVDVDAI
jgi:translation initiation factor 1A